jgi:SecD/SecF fusion protein
MLCCKFKRNCKISHRYFANRSLQGEGGVDFQMTDAEEKVIKRKVESVESALEYLEKRIDKFGVTQPNIQKLESLEELVELLVLKM